MSALPRQSFFCHGAPGGPDDVGVLAQDAATPMMAPNMFATKSGDVIQEMLETFDALTRTDAGGKVHVIGFSIGAMVAIKIAAARPDRVQRLTLISPAAPLGLGDFLPDMAGKPIFDLARNHPKRLQLLTKIQGVFSGVFPNILINQVFAKCGPVEKELLTSESFCKVIRNGFKNSFVQNPEAYINLLQTYVGDWSGDVKNLTCPVEIWHGDKDTWSPISMSQALCDTCPSPATLRIIEGGEHYSTLAKVVLAP